VLGVLGFAVVTFAALMFIPAPYGRQERAGWGPTVPNRVGWILMECPAVLAFVFFYMQGSHRFELIPLLLLGMWQLHYVHRTFIFPFRLRTTGKRMPLLIALLALVFNTLNAWVNAVWIAELGSYGISWLSDPRFILGVVIFMVGWMINIHSDTVLIHLRKPGETGYKLPKGGLYRWVTSPNYLGELLEWTGWAIAAWSTAGFAFAIYTAANLVPRAIQNHAWYLERFDDYPPERKKLIPFLF